MGGIKVIAKRNIIICFGALLALVAIFAPSAAADSELGMYVSPENFVVGTNSRYVSVVIDDLNTNDDYKVDQIDPDEVTLHIKVNGIGVKTVTTYSRTEITDEDGDGVQERVLMYSKSTLFNGIELDSNDVVTFTVTFPLNGKNFELSDDLKLMVPGPGSGGSNKPGDQGPENGGSGNGGFGNKRK